MELSFYNPTKIISGKDVVLKNKEIFKTFGKKAMIVTGFHSAKLNGSLSDVIQALASQSIAYIIFDRIMSNPTIDIVYEGARLARENEVDFVIGIGGGSPMDAAKAIALLAVSDVSQKDLFSGNYKGCLPMIFIPTTSGTGSEVTQYAILTNDEAQTKTTVASPIMFPQVALLDGKYMMGLSKNTTINTTIDALSHAIESYLSKRATPITKMYAVEAIRLIKEQFQNLISYDLTLEARNSLLYASTLAGICISQTGTTAVHTMGYSLTYFKEIDHGRANGLLLGEYLKVVEKKEPKSIAPVLEALGMSTDEFSDTLDTLLGEKDKVSLEEIKTYASKAMLQKNTKNSIIDLTQVELINIMSHVFL